LNIGLRVASPDVRIDQRREPLRLCHDHRSQRSHPTTNTVQIVEQAERLCLRRIRLSSNALHAQRTKTVSRVRAHGHTSVAFDGLRLRRKSQAPTRLPATCDGRATAIPTTRAHAQPSGSIFQPPRRLDP